MRKAAATVLLALGAAFAQPTWLAPYPGAVVETRTFPSFVEATYQTAAKPAEVSAHYRRLFETAKLIFDSSFDGMGTVVRGSAPECDLLIKIREVAAGTLVRVSCAAKTPDLVAVPSAAPPAPARPVDRGNERTAKVLEDARQAGRKRVLDMEKYDQPVAPRPKTAPTWPVWLVHPDGTALAVQKAPSNGLTSVFLTAADPPAILDFYAALVESHGCTVSSHGRSWLSCTAGRFLIRAALTATAQGTLVKLSVHQ